jgi:hypothetical protein
LREGGKYRKILPRQAAFRKGGVEGGTLRGHRSFSGSNARFRDRSSIGEASWEMTGLACSGTVAADEPPQEEIPDPESVPH